jgi:heme exporter protein CcmD
MTNADTEIYYVWAAYGVALAIVTAIILYTLITSRLQRQALAELEAKSARRSSAGAPTT